MKVCLLAVATYGHGISGGMEIHGRALARGLVARGHAVRVLTTRHPDGRTHDRDGGVDVEYLPGTDVAMLRGGWATACERRFAELCAGGEVEVVCCQQPVAPRGVMEAARRARIPVTIIMEGLEVWMLFSAMRQAWSLRSGFGALPRRLASVLYYYLRWELPGLRRCAAVIAVSDEVGRSVRRWAAVPASRVHTVYNGADTVSFAPDAARRRRTRERLGIGPQEPVVLFLSQISGQKGLNVLLRSFVQVLKAQPAARLIVAGDGDYRREAEALAGRLGADERVTFLGHVPHDEASDYLNAADLYVLPTLRLEGLPFSLLQAMACRRPVIASRIGGVPSAIRHGVNGWMVPPDDVERLAAAIVTILGDRALASRLADTAYADAAKRFSADAMVSGTLEVLAAARRLP